MNRHAPIVRVARGAPVAAGVPGSTRPVPLPEGERRHFDSLLRHDFSGVRIHTGAPAAAAASARGARAFTDGGDIAFAAGRYRPDTAAGRALLAHELVHVAQQDRGAAGRGNGSADAEARARRAGARAAGGAEVPIADQGGAGPGVQCDDDTDRDKLLRTEAPLPPALAGKLTLTLPGLGGAAPGAPLPGPHLVPPLTLGAPGTPVPAGGAPYVLPKPSLLPQYHPPGPPLPGWAAAPGPAGAAPLAPVTAPQPPFAGMQNAELLSTFGSHGTTPAAMGISIHGDWAHAYTTFRSYMPEGMAVFSANLFLNSAYQAMLERDAPNVLDLQNRRFKEAYPDAGGIPPLPILSSSSLTTVYEYITGKKNTYRFYF